MDKGLREQLVKISKDGYEKRKRLREALSKDEQEFIDGHPKLVKDFNDDAVKGLKHIMSFENDGSIWIKVCDQNVEMWTVPITAEAKYTIFQRGKFERPNVYLRNFLLKMRDECECSFKLHGDYYILKIF